MVGLVDVDSIVQAVAAVHPPAIFCARAGRPAVIYDGVEGVMLVEDAGVWQWRTGDRNRPLHERAELERLLGRMAERYGREPPSLRAQAEQSVDALRLRWISDARAAPSPRPWGLCAPGQPRSTSTVPRLVLYDVAHMITRERIEAEVTRLHPAALVGSAESWPLIALDGVSWLLFFELQETWHWAIDEELHGTVQDYLKLQVVLAAMATAYTLLGESQRHRAEEQVRALSRQPLPARHAWAHQRARSHGRTGRR